MHDPLDMPWDISSTKGIDTIRGNAYSEHEDKGKKWEHAVICARARHIDSKCDEVLAGYL